ncbi:MAG: hypothetical protein QNJ98_07640 [Planctomycetota bacterium]|nr:hypothetical protein [Planctomycetota bacterium]
MADDFAVAATTEPGSPSPSAIEKVTVRPYPKIIFFWPTWVFSIVAAIIMSASDAGSPPTHLGTVWLCVFAFNLIVIAFDFTEVVSLMVVALIGAVVFAGIAFDFLGPIGDFFASLKLQMNANYYWTMFGLFTLIYFFVFLKTRFDYWEFRHNEVIHRRGVFADIKRYSTEDLRWFKEIPDVLERIMCGAGRMILTTPREQHPIVIQHVVGINRIDEKVADILGVKRVTMK